MGSNSFFKLKERSIFRTGTLSTDSSLWMVHELREFFSKRSFLLRQKDMNIREIEDVQSMIDNEFIKK